jgi:hypothetical protein
MVREDLAWSLLLAQLGGWRLVEFVVVDPDCLSVRALKPCFPVDGLCRTHQPPCGACTPHDSGDPPRT